MDNIPLGDLPDLSLNDITLSTELENLSLVDAFPKTLNIDTKIYNLKNTLIDYINKIICDHEKIFYEIITTKYSSMISQIIGTTDQIIIDMISEANNDYFNKLYFSYQNKVINTETKYIYKLSKMLEYGPHIVMDKLINLVIHTHLEIVRENLNVMTIDDYLESIHDQLENIYMADEMWSELFKDIELYSTDFIVMDKSTKPFNIIIDKPIHNVQNQDLFL